jgi:hypothetical protein
MAIFSWGNDGKHRMALLQSTAHCLASPGPINWSLALPLALSTRTLASWVWDQFDAKAGLLQGFMIVQCTTNHHMEFSSVMGVPPVIIQSWMTILVLDLWWLGDHFLGHRACGRAPSRFFQRSGPPCSRSYLRSVCSHCSGKAMFGKNNMAMDQ